jgi:hypothetical protein
LLIFPVNNKRRRLAMSTTLYGTLSFDFSRDIAPVASIGGGAYVMVVNPSVPARTVSDGGSTPSP